MKCKRCKCRIPNSHQGEFAFHQCHCRKCWAIVTSVWKDVKNTEDDLRKEDEEE